MRVVEPWVTGLVNCVLYDAMFHSDGSALDDDLVRRYAVALRVRPLSDEPLHRQAAGLRAAVASDAVLASAFEPYPGRRPYDEAEFRAFLTRLADAVEESIGPDEPDLPDAPGPPTRRVSPMHPVSPMRGKPRARGGSARSCAACGEPVGAGHRDRPPEPGAGPVHPVRAARLPVNPLARVTSVARVSLGARG